MSPTYLRLIVLIMVFGCVVLAIEGIVGWVRGRSGTERTINRRLKMIAAGGDRGEVLARLRRDDELSQVDDTSALGRLQRSMILTLHAAGVNIRLNNLLVIILAAFGGLMMLGLTAASFSGYALSPGTLLLLLCVSGAVAVGLPLMTLSRMSQRRRKKMEMQFPVALDTFVRGLRAGHPISAAIDLLTKEMADPVGTEFGIVTDEVNYGSDLRDALQRMADRWSLNEIHMFVVSLSVQSETGGNLAEILENLSGVIRERQSLFMKVRALSSEGRVTALILTALPVLAFTALFLLNPSFYLDVAQDPAFVTGFGSLVLLFSIGVLTIRKMVDLKV